MAKISIKKTLVQNGKLKISNPPPSIQSSAYIRDTVLPILKSSITNFYEYSYDGDDYSIGDGGGDDMYDGGNRVILNGVAQIYGTESANTFCYRSSPFIYKTTQTSNFTLSVQGNYGSDGNETMYQYQQDFDYQGRKFSIYISENIDNSEEDPSIVECFIVLYPNNKPTINFTFSTSGAGEGNETINVSNLNGQSVTAFYLLLSNYPPVQIGSVTLFDVLKTFVVNCTTCGYNKKLRIKAPPPFPIANLFAFWNLNESSGTRYDSSGNGRNLTQTFGTVSSTTGKIANCAYFDGLDGGGSRNSKLGSTSFGVDVLNNFSMSVWMKPRSFSNFQHIIGAPFQNGFYIGADNSNLTFNLYNGTVYGINAPSTALDTWHHYVFIREGNTLKLYADNVYIGSADITGESFDNGSVFSVGGGEYNEYYFNGDIDALGLWTRALTESEIASLYNGGNGSEI